MASQQEVVKLEIKLRDTYSRTVSELRSNYADYVTEYGSNDACSYADYLSVVEHLERNALS